MHTPNALLDFHERSHRSLIELLAHCRKLSQEELNRELDGFGYPTIQLQLHHEIAAERYWIGVLEGRIDVDDDASSYSTIESLEDFRARVFAATKAYLQASSEKDLITARPMMTWGNKEKVLTPAQVVIRTQTHLYQHQGQILAMCRLMGKQGSGLDYPIT